MTSTNDGKDVKSNQTSGPKGKTYYIELYKSLEAGLSKDCELSERTQSLCLAWRRVHSLCAHSAASTHPHLLSWLQRHTARTVLQTEWQDPTNKIEHSHLEEAINDFIAESKSSKDGDPPWQTQLVARGEWFKRILASPWGHPVLKMLLDPQGEETPTDEEVLTWLKDERGVMFVTRLRQLAATKNCHDLALRLASSIMDRVRAGLYLPKDELVDDLKEKERLDEGSPFLNTLKAEAGFTVDVLELITDIEFVLLHKRDKRARCIELAKQTPLRNGYQLVERLQSRLGTSPREKKLWKNAKEVAILIAQVVIARCMVVPVCGGASRSALYCCARSLARLVPAARLPAAAQQLAMPAVTARHLHTLAAAVDAQSSSEMKPHVCELYVRAITAGMNELERLKLTTEKASEARSLEQTLSQWFLHLGAALSNERMRCECTLTAFSVHPSPAMYDMIKDAPDLAPVALDIEPKSEQTNSEFGSWANDSRSQTNLVKTSETLNLKKHSQHQANVLSTAIVTEGEALGLSTELCQDIVVLLSGPRLKTLSWDMDRTLLLENCRTYMERTNYGTRALTTELKYLNLDLREYEHLPEEEEDDSDMYYGIEKGYEHLVEFQEAEEIWEDAHDSERTLSAYPSDIEPDINKPKKKNKKVYLDSEEDEDPLSMLAEATRVERKKERPHSKERKERKPKTKTKPKDSQLTDPLDIGENTETQNDTDANNATTDAEIKKPAKKKQSTERKAQSLERKNEGKEKKEKKERKRKEQSVSKEPKAPLSSLVGMKITNMADKNKVPMVDSDFDSQGNNSILSEGSDSNVLFDGLFSMDEIKSPEKSFKNDIHMANGAVRMNTPTPDNRRMEAIRVPTPNMLPSPVRTPIPTRTCTPNIMHTPNRAHTPSSNRSETRTPENFTTVTEEVKKSITRLIEFRRQKAASQAQQPNTFMQPDIQPNSKYVQPQPHLQPQFSPAQIDQMRAYSNKSHPHSIQEGNMLHQQKSIARPVIQFGQNQSQNSNYTFDTTGTKVNTESTNPINYTNAKVGTKIANMPYRPKPVVQPQTKSNKVTPHQKDFHDFLKELQESINAGTGAESRQVKKEIKPTNRVNPVIPKSDPKVTPCAKQPVKIPDTAPNTFSRLSYYKSTKNELKAKQLIDAIVEHQSQKLQKNEIKSKQLVDAIVEQQQQRLSNSPSFADLDRILEEQKQAKIKYLQASKESVIKPSRPRDNTQNVIKRSSSISGDHTLISGLLNNSINVSKTSVNQCNNAQPEKSRDLSNKLSSSLTEKDQQDLVLLLRQQSKQNLTRPIPDTSKERVPPPQTSTSSTGPIYKTPSLVNKRVLDLSTSVIKNNPSQAKSSVKTAKERRPAPKPIIVKTELSHAKNLDQVHSKIQKVEVIDNEGRSVKSSANKGKSDGKSTDWESVMDALLKHKTPSRGPNALDMTLKNVTFISAYENSLRDQGIVKPPSRSSSESMLSTPTRDAKESQSKTQSKSAIDNILRRSNTDIKITKASKSKTKKDSSNPSSSVRTHSENRTLLKSEQLKKVNNEKKSKDTNLTKRRVERKQQFTCALPKEDDPFISGIHNSDYDLLEELMDDDLRQEIGELLSDDDCYNTSIPGVKDTRAFVGINKTMSPVIQDDKRIVPPHVENVFSKPNPKNNVQKVPTSISKPNYDDTISIGEPAGYTSLPVHSEYTKVQNIITQPTTNINHMATANINQMPTSVIIPPKKEHYVNAVPTVDQTFVAMPQQTSLQNVVLIGSDLVYQPCVQTVPAVRTPIHTGLPQNRYVTFNPQSNIVYQTHYTAPVINPLIIGNAMTASVPVTEPPSTTNLNIMTPKPFISPEVAQPQIVQPQVEQSQMTLAEMVEPQITPPQVAKETISHEPQKLINEVNVQTNAKVDCSLDDFVFKDKCDINSNKNGERKVLSEVQELIFKEKMESNTKSQKLSFDRDMKKTADAERLKLKRMAILNRNINHRSDTKPIPLTYTPLKIKKPEADITQENNLALDSSANPSNDTLVYSSLHSDDAEDEAIEVKEVSNENCKENNEGAVPCRRILLRSSNQLKTEASPVNTSTNKTKVKLKGPPDTAEPEKPAETTDEVLLADVDSIKVIKRRGPKKTLNKSIEHVEIKKRITRQSSRNSLSNNESDKTVADEEKTVASNDKPPVTDLLYLVDIEDQLASAKILKNTCPESAGMDHEDTVDSNNAGDLPLIEVKDGSNPPTPIVIDDDSLSQSEIVTSETIESNNVTDNQPNNKVKEDSIESVRLQCSNDTVNICEETIHEHREIETEETPIATKEILDDTALKDEEKLTKETSMVEKTSVKAKKPKVNSVKDKPSTPPDIKKSNENIEKKESKNEVPQAEKVITNNDFSNIGTNRFVEIVTAEKAPPKIAQSATDARTEQTTANKVKPTEHTVKAQNDDPEVICLDNDDDTSNIDQHKNIKIIDVVENSLNHKNSKPEKPKENDCGLSQSFLEGVTIEEIKQPGMNDPLRRCVRIKLPNGRAFKATVRGQAHLSIDTIFSDPALKSVLMRGDITRRDKYTLNIKHCTTQNPISKKIENRIHQISLQESGFKKDETISLLSDDEEDIAYFDTEFGKYKVPTMQSTLHKKHQNRLNNKCVVKLSKVSLSETKDVKLPEFEMIVPDEMSDPVSEIHALEIPKSTKQLGSAIYKKGISETGLPDVTKSAKLLPNSKKEAISKETTVKASIPSVANSTKLLDSIAKETSTKMIAPDLTESTKLLRNNEVTSEKIAKHVLVQKKRIAEAVPNTINLDINKSAKLLLDPSTKEVVAPVLLKSKAMEPEVIEIDDSSNEDPSLNQLEKSQTQDKILELKSLLLKDLGFAEKSELIISDIITKSMETSPAHLSPLARVDRKCFVKLTNCDHLVKTYNKLKQCSINLVRCDENSQDESIKPEAANDKTISILSEITLKDDCYFDSAPLSRSGSFSILNDCNLFNEEVLSEDIIRSTSPVMDVYDRIAALFNRKTENKLHQLKWICETEWFMSKTQIHLQFSKTECNVIDMNDTEDLTDTTKLIEATDVSSTETQDCNHQVPKLVSILTKFFQTNSVWYKIGTYNSQSHNLKRKSQDNAQMVSKLFKTRRNSTIEQICDKNLEYEAIDNNSDAVFLEGLNIPAIEDQNNKEICSNSDSEINERPSSSEETDQQTFLRDPSELMDRCSTPVLILNVGLSETMLTETVQAENKKVAVMESEKNQSCSVNKIEGINEVPINTNIESPHFEDSIEQQNDSGSILFKTIDSDSGNQPLTNNNESIDLQNSSGSILVNCTLMVTEEEPRDDNITPCQEIHTITQQKSEDNTQITSVAMHESLISKSSAIEDSKSNKYIVNSFTTDNEIHTPRTVPFSEITLSSEITSESNTTDSIERTSNEIINRSDDHIQEDPSESSATNYDCGLYTINNNDIKTQSDYEDAVSSEAIELSQSILSVPSGIASEANEIQDNTPEIINSDTIVEDNVTSSSECENETPNVTMKLEETEMIATSSAPEADSGDDSVVDDNMPSLNNHDDKISINSTQSEEASATSDSSKTGSSACIESIACNTATPEPQQANDDQLVVEDLSKPNHEENYNDLSGSEDKQETDTISSTDESALLCCSNDSTQEQLQSETDGISQDNKTIFMQEDSNVDMVCISDCVLEESNNAVDFSIAPEPDSEHIICNEEINYDYVKVEVNKNIEIELTTEDVDHNDSVNYTITATDQTNSENVNMASDKIIDGDVNQDIVKNNIELRKMFDTDKNSNISEGPTEKYKILNIIAQKHTQDIKESESANDSIESSELITNTPRSGEIGNEINQNTVNDNAADDNLQTELVEVVIPIYSDAILDKELTNTDIESANIEEENNSSQEKTVKNTPNELISILDDDWQSQSTKEDLIKQLTDSKSRSSNEAENNNVELAQNDLVKNIVEVGSNDELEQELARIVLGSAESGDTDNQILIINADNLDFDEVKVCCIQQSELQKLIRIDNQGGSPKLSLIDYESCEVQTSNATRDDDDCSQTSDDILQITQEMDEFGNVKEIDIRLNVPKRTYSRKTMEENYTLFGDKRNKRNLKRKGDMTDLKTPERKYRKGKNIDTPKLTVIAKADTAYCKEYKQLFDYCSSVKFSYSRPFHKEYIDVEAMIKSWPIQGDCNVEVESQIDENLFTDTDIITKSIHDPLTQTLAEEIMAEYNETTYCLSDAKETNFQMGFGEGSGRVIQNSEDDGVLKFSAATLSDVKQTQPLLPSENYENCNCVQDGDMIDSTKNELEKLQRNYKCIQLKNKVRAFFKKSMVELHSEWAKQLAKNDNIYSCQDMLVDKTCFPFGLNLPEFITPSPVEVVVQVVQVGQLPVSAAAQNPVTCDPRVTQVSDASPSQCSADNSLSDDPHSAIKTEYTELTTADISLPLQNYVHHHNLMPSDSHDMASTQLSNDIVIEEIKEEIKEEIVEEPEMGEEISNHFDNDGMSDYDSTHIENINFNNNVDYTYESTPPNHLSPTTTVSETTLDIMYDSTPKTHVQQSQQVQLAQQNQQMQVAQNQQALIDHQNQQTHVEHQNQQTLIAHQNHQSQIVQQNQQAQIVQQSHQPQVSHQTQQNNHTQISHQTQQVQIAQQNQQGQVQQNSQSQLQQQNLQGQLQQQQNTQTLNQQGPPPLQNQQGQPSQQNHQEHHNGTSEKTDQIAHAMNAAGITTTSENIANTRAHALVNILSQKLRQGTVGATSTGAYPKTTQINAMALQQALAQILPPPLNPTNNNSENNQQNSTNTPQPQVVHIVQGKNASGNQITLVDNSQPSVISTPNNTPVLHIVQNKANTSGSTSNGTPPQHANSFSGLSLVDAGLQQGNQLVHIVNTGNQKNANAGQLLRKVNLLTNLANVQGSNEQKMVQFVCKSADGKAIQLNGPHQRSMVLRLQPVESPGLQLTQSKPAESTDANPPSSNNGTNKDAASQQEIKSRSVYEENYAKFIQSSNKPAAEKATSLPKFGQAFGKQVFQDGTQKNDATNGNSHLSSGSETPDCQPNDNAINLEHISQISSPPLLLRKSPQTSQAQPNLVQQLKQTISPMNMSMHGGVIYTRQFPVNIGGGQTINLITVPSTDLIDDSASKQTGNQEGVEPSIIKIVPQAATSSSETPEENNSHPSGSNETPTPQPQPVLTQMRIKLPMLSKGPQMVSGARLVRPSFFQIQRNVIGGANQPVYQQLVLTAAPPLGQQTIRLPQTQTSRQVKVPSESQSSTESQMSSSTLEQLREFDLVLEQVKERSTGTGTSTSQPSATSSSGSFSKLHTPSTDTTDSAPSASSTPAQTTQQVLYSIGNSQPLNVTYVNRKATSATPTTSSFQRSPDSSGIVESPTSSTHQRSRTVTSESSASDTPASSSHTSHSGHSTQQTKPAKVKAKPRPKAASNPPNTLKLPPAPPKTSTQKPAEDEQTTQRILYILAEYKEQVENSPDKDKPAPRRRTNPPSNPGGSSKRKKSSSGSRRSGRDMSPCHGDETCRTMGSEDSSCGTSQGDCNDCLESHSPQDSPRKVVRKLTFEHETPTPSTQPRPQPQRNVIVADGQTITVARGTSGKPTTAVLMPANYILPVSMVKGGQQIAIVTNRGPKLLTVGGGEGGTTNALLLQRLIGPAGLKPVLTRPGVRHVRLPTAALHNLQAFNLAAAAATTVQPPDSTASPAPAPTPDLVDTRATSSPWRTDRESHGQKSERERASSPEGSEPWNLPPSEYSYEETVRGENMDRTVLDPIPDRYSPDMEAQRIFDKMFDVDSKKSYMVDSHDDSPRCGYDIDASDCDDKAYHQVVHKKDGSAHRQHRFANMSAVAMRHKYAMLEQELRLQKSLSEECEDLGVDSPSASELFPEAELLFAASPAHDHTQDQGHHSHTPQPLLSQSGIPQPDMDDQIATDQLLPRADIHDDRELGLGLEDVGIVTVSADGMQATIQLDQEEFARSHPNTTFHSEPTDDGEVQQPFTISGLKARHITSIFHSNRPPGTVLMTAAPQTTVISQATAETSGVHHNAIKYSDIDNMINSLPSTHSNNINLSSVLVKDDGLSRFDNLLNDSRELHLSNTASAIVHSAGHATQVIRRVCYEDDKRERDNRFLMDEPDGLIAGDDAKMMAEDSSREATLESMGGDTTGSSPERHTELFWESNSASGRADFSSDSEKCCKSPSDDTSTDSSAGVGVSAHMRLDSVIKEARGLASDDDAPPLRTYPAPRSLSGKTAPSSDGPGGRRRASGRGVVKRGTCLCCVSDAAPPRPKKPRQRRPALDFAAAN